MFILKITVFGFFIFILRNYLYSKFLESQKKYFFTLAVLIGFLPAVLLPFFASIKQIDSYSNSALVLLIVIFVLYFPLSIKKLYRDDEGKYSLK